MLSEEIHRPLRYRQHSDTDICIVAGRGLTMTGRNVGQSTRINDTETFRPFDPQVRIHDSPRVLTPRYRGSPNDVKSATPNH